MMFKKFLKVVSLAAVAGMMVIFPAAAEEDGIIPMSELNVQEDPDWSEDGEIFIDDYGRDTEENYGFEEVHYRSAGVASSEYASIEKQGLDVSHHQKLIDWTKVKAAGMEFAMIRVGYRGYGGGAIYPDEYFETNIKNAQAAGLKVGIYFFSQALNEQEAREEASYTIQMIQKYNITYPVAFDWETAPGYRTYDVALSKAQMNSLADTFCSMVSGAGYIPMVYSNTRDFQGRFDYQTLADRYYIWYARYLPEYGGTTWYASGNRLPNYDNNIQFNMWQYMSDGIVPGVDGYCDVNVTFLDFGTYRKQEVTLSASSGKIKIDERNLTITGVPAQTGYSALKTYFPDFDVTVNNSSVAGSAQGSLKTGDKLTFVPRRENTYMKNNTYTLVIRGDVDGNGRVDVLDMEEIQKSILRLSTLDTIHFMAARVTGGESLSVLDMEAVQKHILGLDNLYE